MKEANNFENEIIFEEKYYSSPKLKIFAIKIVKKSKKIKGIAKPSWEMMSGGVTTADTTKIAITKYLEYFKTHDRLTIFSISKTSKTSGSWNRAKKASKS